jgi:hypothetical protein
LSSKVTTAQTRNHTHTSQVSEMHFEYAVVSKMSYKCNDYQHITVLEAEEVSENLDMLELHRIFGDTKMYIILIY